MPVNVPGVSRWRRNVTCIWASQFLSIMGFSFGMPFAPYFIQELGVNDPQELKLWVSLFAAATPCSLALFSPIWGTLADRFGRRVMLLRANFAAAVVLCLMSTVTSPLQIIFLRLMQGAFTGTMTAAQTMVSVQVPEDRSGAALGTLSACVYSGAMAGAFLGGLTADIFGYRVAFCVSSWLLLAAGVLVVFGTTEERPVPTRTRTRSGPLFRFGWPRLGAAMPILILIIAMSFVRQFDQAFLALLVQEIHGSLAGVAMRTGTLAAVGGIAGFLSGMVLGRLADRFAPPKIAVASALGAALFMLPQAIADDMSVLFVARFAMIFCAGGLDPIFQIWLAKVTPEDRRGAVFGWAGTAKAIGWMMAPLMSGLVAAGFGIRAIYFVESLLFLALIFVIRAVVKRIRA